MCRQVNSSVIEDFASKDISLQEVEIVMNELNVQRSPEINNVNSDIFKKSKVVVAPVLCNLSNKVLKVRIDPDDRCDLNMMYSKMKSCVQNENYLSDDFYCNIGRRQGCQLSPLVIF